MSACNKSITNSKNENVKDLAECPNGAEYTATNSATITFLEGIDCSQEGTNTLGDVTLVVSHSATINVAAIFHYPYIKCDTLTIKADHASTVTIYSLDCNELILDVAYASTVTIAKGRVGTASGTIQHASTGVCHASIDADRVIKDGDSTWST